MKKLILLSALLIFACSSDDSTSDINNSYFFEIELGGETQVFPLIFECNGGRVNFQDPDYPERYDWVRLGADCN